MKELLQKLKITLNQVEVRGQNNLDMMLGCLLTIDKAIAEMDGQGAKETEGGAHDNTDKRGNDA